MLEFFTTIPLEVFTLGLVAAFGLAAFLVLSRLEEKASARSSLRNLEDYEIEDKRADELLKPLHERILTPAVAGLGRFGGRFNPPDYVESVRLKHMQAGIPLDRVERFLAIRILAFVLIPVWLVVILLINPIGGLGPLLRLVLAGIGVFGLITLPNSRLKAKVDIREASIQRAMPDVLDLLVISVEAGLGFEQAVDRVIQNVPGELSDEFARVLGETAAGSTRADALRSLQERLDVPEIRSFVLAMIQADRFGVSIGRVLRSQADEMRIKRSQLAQEKAQKAPVKMLLPMVFCIFPSLFIVILGPAFLDIRDKLLS